jgi:hypothetical protein
MRTSPGPGSGRESILRYYDLRPVGIASCLSATWAGCRTLMQINHSRNRLCELSKVARTINRKTERVDMKWEYRLFPVGLDRGDYVIQETLNRQGNEDGSL